jgi:aryl carrier-like protein
MKIAVLKYSLKSTEEEENLLQAGLYSSNIVVLCEW